MPSSGRDIELVARANRGDASACEELYQHYRSFVFRLALRRLGNTDDALDVTHDTFVRLFTRFPGFELSVAMTSFLRSHVEPLCLDYQARRVSTIHVDPLEVAESVAAESDSDRREMSLLAPLPADERELLTLRFVEDLSLPQLSQTLAVPIGTIKSRLHRAIARLRGKLSPTQPLLRRGFEASEDGGYGE